MIAKIATEKQWQALVIEIVGSNYEMELGRLSALVGGLTLSEKEAIWETFKAESHLEDNPDTLEERIVSL